MFIFIGLYSFLYYAAKKFQYICDNHWLAASRFGILELQNRVTKSSYETVKH